MKKILLVTGVFYTLTSVEGEVTNAYFYDNPDSDCEGFGFNIADGGGFLPEYDITDSTVISMSFGQATEAAKRGYKVGRIGWNGAKMYAVIMPGFPDGCPANEVTASIHGIPVGATLSIRPYWALKTAQNDIAMWAPSGSDSLADDWVIVE